VGVSGKQALTGAILLVAAVLAGACGEDDSGPTATPIRPPTGTPSAVGFTLSSNSFGPEQTIPERYTCESANISPALSWSNQPAGVQSFALIVDDPDAPAGSFTHWLIFDLPADTTFLPEDVDTGERPAVGGVQGTNDGSKIGYTGPCPPEGSPHRYVFTLFALDTALGLEPGVSKAEVLAPMENHILGQTTLTGTFQR
jgi:Raf kinase inhibitor-like YbhB/YbcL family protein